MTPKNSKRLIPLFIFSGFLLLLWIFPSARPTPVVALGQGLVGRSMSWIVGVGDRLFGSVHGVTDFFTSRRVLQLENERLKERVGRMEERLSQFDALVQDHERLQAALDFVGRSPYRYRLLAAEVTGRSPSHWFEMITLNRGRESGVTVDMPVVHPTGLVGRVLQVQRRSAQVLLLSDPRSQVGVMNPRTGELGLLRGGGGRLLKLEYLLADSATQVGDSMVTASTSSYYPRGLSIGVVEAIERRPGSVFAEVSVRPAVATGTLDRLFILLR